MPEKKRDERTRNWTIIVYPESAPENWKDILDSYHIGWLCSPLHDKDVNPDGDLKKAHWHVVLVFENKKSFAQIKEIADRINSPIPQKVEGIRGMVRYLIHLDNPEKYQYSKDDIENHGVYDIERYFKNSSTDRQTLIEIVNYIRQEHITSFSTLTYYAIDTENEDWFDTLSQRSTIFLREVIQGEYHKQKKLQSKLSNKLKDSSSETLNSAVVDSDKVDIGWKDLTLVERKKMAFELSIKGYSAETIANTLGVTKRTVKNYLKS